MIDMVNVDYEKYPVLPEVRLEFLSILDDFFSDVNKVLDEHKLSSDEVVWLQIKEKPNGRLRIYFTMEKFTEDIEDEEREKLDIAYELLENLVEKYEKINIDKKGNK